MMKLIEAIYKYPLRFTVEFKEFPMKFEVFCTKCGNDVSVSNYTTWNDIRAALRNCSHCLDTRVDPVPWKELGVEE
jgi:hypothetical protein